MRSSTRRATSRGRKFGGWRLESLETRQLLSVSKTFRTDTGPDLDLYQPCDGGDNLITFDVDVAGIDLKTVRSARLTMSVWDVDYTGSGSGGQPERDPVSINGHAVGRPTSYLTGANNQWSTCSFDVDPSWLVDGKNTVNVQIDVLGGGWCVKVDWGELSLEAQDLRVERLTATDDVNMTRGGAAIGDVVWDIGGKSEPIADAAKSGATAGRFNLKANLGVDTGAFPGEDYTVRYDWAIAGSSKKGTGQFVVNSSKQEGDITIATPGAVGQYALKIDFKITDKDGKEVKKQSMTQTLYATLAQPLLGGVDPELVWVQKATSWASGAADDVQVAGRLNSSIYAQGWRYRDVPATWQELVEGAKTEGNCVSFSYVWNAMGRVLGVATDIAPRVTNPKNVALGFITTTGNVSQGGEIPGTAHPPGSAPDRWFFTMHQFGVYKGTYYDPTFNKTWTGKADSFVAWYNTGVAVDPVHGYVRTGGGYKVYPSGANPAHGWGDMIYEPLSPPPPAPGPIAPPAPLMAGASALGAGGLAFTSTGAPRGVDANGDGLFEGLAFDLTLTAAAPGDYSISGFLGAGGEFITDRASRDNMTSLNVPVHVDAPGPVTITVVFSGEDIFQSGIEGPYTASLWISNGAGFIDQADFVSSGLARGQFGEVPLTITGTTDAGRDLDADGKFDDLVVEVSIASRAGATGRIEGILLSAAGDVIAAVSVPLAPTPPGGVARLVFDGSAIAAAGVDGPYTLLTSIFQNGTATASFTSATKPYAADDFGSRGTVGGGFSDKGEDTDGDGKFDLLVIETTVDVAAAGDYAIEASLLDSNGAEIGSVIQTQTFAAGRNTARLAFDGEAIYRNGVNGPYSVRYVALRDDAYLDFIDQAATTAAYNYTQFDAPVISPIALTGVYGANPVDADGDGLYDFLDIEVEVLAQTNGSYNLNARLMDFLGGEIAWASTAASLQAGTPTKLVLRYNGADIGANGLSGPFTLQDVYIYSANNSSVADSAFQPFVTPAYDGALFANFTPRNLPPVIDPIADVVVSEGGVVSIAVKATDPLGGKLLYELCPCAPAGMTIDPDTGVITWTADDGGAGAGTAHSFFVTVTNNGVPPQSATRNIVVNVKNAAPTAAIAGAGSIGVGESLVLTLSAADPSAADRAAGFDYQIDWDGDGVVDETIHGPATLQVSRAFAAPGARSIRVTAVDKDGEAGPAAVHRVDVDVAPPPIATTQTTLAAPPATAPSGSAIILRVEVRADSGVPGGIVRFFVDGAEVGSAALRAETDRALASWTVAGLAPGAHRFAATYDGAQGFAPSASATVATTVEPPSGPLITGVQRIDVPRLGTRFVIGFNRDMDPDGVVNLDNYRLAARGLGGAFGPAYNRSIPISRAVYSPATRSVSLFVRGRAGLRPTLLAVVPGAGRGVADRLGNALDGDADGAAGGSFVSLVGGRAAVNRPSSARLAFNRLAARSLPAQTIRPAPPRSGGLMRS